MFRILVFLIVLLGFVADVQARYCNNPYCAMCNRIFGPMPGYAIVNGRIVRAHRRTTTVQKPIEKPEEKPEEKPVFEPTPHEAIPSMLELVKPTADETVYDLGCGDARILIKAVETYGCKAVGIEKNSATARLAESEANKSGVGKRILIVEGDILDYKLDNADVIVMYLFPSLMDKIRRRISPGTRVVTYSHDIPSAHTEKKIVWIKGKEYVFYIWTKPYVY